MNKPDPGKMKINHQKNSTIRVLHVDDEVDFLSITKDFVERITNGEIQIDPLSDSSQTIDILHKKKYDVIVCDYLMPSMDGLDLLKEIKDKNIDIPFIIFTGRSREEVVIQALNLGADSYLRKGGDAKSQFSELVNDIKNIVKHKRAEEDLKESEERFSHFMDNLPAIAFIKDEKGKVWYVNKYMREKYGAGDALGQTIAELFPQDRAEVIEEEDKKIREDGLTVTSETRADKHRFGLDFNTIKFPISVKGKPSWIGGIGIDISEQKKTEKELKESEEKFRQIFNNTKDGIFIHDLDENMKLGNFIEVNDVACEWTGFNRDELLQMNPYDLDKEGLFKSFKGVGKTFRKNGRVVFESTLTSKAGDAKPIEFNSHNFVLKGKEVILTVARDLSKQKITEVRLMESEEKYRHIFQYANDAIYLYPISKNGVPGKFIEVNDNASKMLGYSKKEFLKMSPIDVAAKGTVKRISKIVKEVIEKKQMTFEATHKTKEGKSLPVELSAHIFDFRGEQVMLSLVRDISERKRREEELQKSYNLYRILFETTGTANLLFDEDGTIVLFNTRMESISGYKKEDVEGKRKWLEFIPRPELDMMVNFNEIRKEDPKKVPVQYESRFISSDGKIRDIILTVKSIPGTTNFLASLIDITERKKVEDEITKQKDELSDFAHFMGHDIRNSLTAIEGYVEELKEKYEDLYLEKILRRTIYVGNLLEHSIELAEAGTTVEKADKVDLDRLVSTVADVIIPKSIKFNKDNLGNIEGDNGKLSQVFKNLFENAIIYGKPNKVSVTKTEKKDKIVISISNDGILIKENIITKVFDRGYSSKKGSTGLGLSIVKKIVEGHNWEISIDTKENQTNFRIIVPKE